MESILKKFWKALERIIFRGGKTKIMMDANGEKNIKNNSEDLSSKTIKITKVEITPIDF